ncbi:MAG: hypothetical protein ACLPSH_05750 [Vulcanimicrobiaceae bacterium]
MDEPLPTVDWLSVKSALSLVESVMTGLTDPVIAAPEEVKALSASVNEPALPSDGMGVTWASLRVAALWGAAELTGVGDVEGVTVPATLSEHAASPRTATIAAIRDFSRDGRNAIKENLLVE